MKTVILLSCVFGIALCVPVITRDPQPIAEIPSTLQIEGSDGFEVARKRRQLFGVDIDIYNNNGYGYFGMS